MKPAALLIALISQAATPVRPDPHYFAYTRPITLTPGPAPRACTILDAPIFAHANPTLSDLRLYANFLLSSRSAAEGPAVASSEAATPTEIPYATTISETSQAPPDPARILNLGQHTGHITFDLQMPPRNYTQVILDLAATNFLATAQVTGLHTLAQKKPDRTSTDLGTYTLFDLTAQHLSRSATLPLQESSFPYLHLDLAVTPAPSSPPQTFAPAIVQGAQIPPTREAQTIYTPIAQTTSLTQLDRKTIATFTVPAKVPVERITFTLPATFKPNFSRQVQITATPQTPTTATPETISGEITQLRLTTAGREIHQEQLSIPATLGANLQSPAKIEIAVDNGDDRPLPLTSVRLEMRQRQLCFAPPADSAVPLTLLYGDPTLKAPIYDYARLFNPASPTRQATLAPEQPNPTYTPRPAPQLPLTERHPELLWVALLSVVGILGVIAFRSSKNLTPHH